MLPEIKKHREVLLLAAGALAVILALAMRLGCSPAADPEDPDPAAPKAHCRILDPETRGDEGVAQWFSRKGCERRCEELRRSGTKDCRWGTEALAVDVPLREEVPVQAREEAADPIHALERRAGDFSLGITTPRAQETEEPRLMRTASAERGGAASSHASAPGGIGRPAAPGGHPGGARPPEPAVEDDGKEADFEGNRERLVTFRQEGNSTASRGGSCNMAITNPGVAAAKFKLEMAVVAGKEIPLHHVTIVKKIGNAKVRSCGAGICGTLRSGDGVTLIFEFGPPENAEAAAGSPVCMGTIQAKDAESTPGFVSAAGTVAVVDTFVPIVVEEGRPF